MTLKVLSPEQIDQFIECGYAVVEEAFPRKWALENQEYLWKRLEQHGVQKDDKTTWREPMVHMQENYTDEIFLRCATERLANAMDDLVGSGRRRIPGNISWGWWPVNFSVGANKPWDVPLNGWHWDGIHFRHAVDAPDQGLLALCIFSEIAPHGGGSVIAEGSHKLVANFLKQYSEGIELDEAIGLCKAGHPWLAELTGKASEQLHAKNRIEYFMETVYHDEIADLRVLETTGSPGDVILCHPFLFHSAAQNHSGIPRFMCNRTAELTERLNFQRSDDNYSPLEISIKRVIEA